ncbi:hypothetical protein FQ707_10965 [Bacteroidaceae bacterium HV4-6-C5C]|nr:hypothetical protein FQ707_10965 [Bacteroidaceae bacterium HV4-6-C5C]
MKKYTFIIILFLFILSCEQRNTALQNDLYQAEKLMEARPDSVRTLLLRLQSKIEDANRADRMKYILLSTEADDKCFVNHPSDSAMLEAAAYYDHNGTPLQRMKSYYLLGRIYSDMQFTGEALNSFRKALEIECKDDTPTYTVRARASNHIGHTYMYQGLYSDALPYFYKSYYFAKLAKNESIVVFALRDIGRSLCTQGQTRKGLTYYEYAASVARKTKQEELYKMVIGELADGYRKIKDYTRAKRALILGNGLLDAESLYPHYVCWANYYRDIGKTDSAIYFYSKCIQSPNNSIAKKAALSLADIYADRGDYKWAFPYFENYAANADALNQKESVKNQNLIKVLNNKLHVERENRLLKEKTSTLRLMSVTFSAVFIIVIILVFYYLRNKKLQYLNQEERLKRVMSLMEHNSRQKLQDNSERIRILREQLSSSQMQNDNLLKRFIQLEKESLQGENSRIKAEREKQTILQQRLKSSVFYLKFYQLAKSHQKASNDDFRQLIQLVDETYSNFTHRLIELCPYINEKEIRICLLIKIGLTPTQISDIICSSNSGVSMIRQRLYMKIFQLKGKPDEFDKKIMEF